MSRIRTLSALIGRPYSDALASQYDWGTAYPLVAVRGDGTVDEITGIVDSGADADGTWVTLDVDGDRRPIHVGDGADAAALRSDLLLAGLLSPTLSDLHAIATGQLLVGPDADHTAQWIDEYEGRTWDLPTYALLVGTSRVILWTLADGAGVDDVAERDVEADLDAQVQAYAEEVAAGLGSLVEEEDA